MTQIRISIRYNWSSEEYYPISQYTPEEIDEFLEAASHPMESMWYCAFQSVTYDCKDLFKMVKTSGGIYRMLLDHMGFS